MLARLATPTLALATLFAVGCGADATSSAGELGMLRYTLFTDYDVPQGNLTGATIVAGHRQTIHVDLTEEGRKGAGNPGTIEHIATPAAGVTITAWGGSDSSASNFYITVTESGSYQIESRLDGEVFDKITLKFETPAGFELLLQQRGPYEDAFSKITNVQSTISCVEGTQVTIDAAPLNGAGARLAGSVQSDVTITPSWAVVPGVGVVESYEAGVWSTSGQANFYFIDPVVATLTVSDPVSGANQSATFDVTPIPKP